MRSTAGLVGSTEWGGAHEGTGGGACSKVPSESTFARLLQLAVLATSPVVRTGIDPVIACSHKPGLRMRGLRKH
jgi:hypothetical protein